MAASSTASSRLALNSDELCQELNLLLEAFCSDVQQKFCLDQCIATQPQLQRARQTIQQVRGFIPGVGLVGNPNSASLRQSLTRTSLEMLDCYQTVCHQRHIQTLSDDAIQPLMLEWQDLSQAFDTKAKEQANLVQLIKSVKELRAAWKRPRQVQRIMTSILATYEPRSGAYVVMTDRHNYSQLGLKRKAVGSRHIIFECNRLTKGEQMEAISGLCDRFAAIFAQNAQQNLLQIDAQIRLGQPTSLAKKLRRLRDRVCTTDPVDHDVGSNRLSNIHSLSLHSTSSESANSRPHEDNAAHSNHARQPPRPPRHSPPLPEHLQHDPSQVQSLNDLDEGLASIWPSSTVHASLWYLDRGASLQRMPTPSFVPTPWEWPDLLKVRRPYQPLLFGLIKRRKQWRRGTSFFIRLRGLFSTRPPLPGSTEIQHAEPAEDAFASVSVASLCNHFCRTGRQFYDDVLSNAGLKYHQDTQLLEQIGRDLVDLYALLQIEASRMAMQRILTILYELTEIDQRMGQLSSS